MAVTEPKDLAFPGGNRNSEDTETTNEMSKSPGFPCRKQDGSLVLIVDQMAVGTTKVLIDEHGNQYRDDQVDGVLIPVTDETVEEIDESDVNGSLDESDAEPSETPGTEDFETTMDRFGASEPGETFEPATDETVEATEEDAAQSA